MINSKSKKKCINYSGIRGLRESPVTIQGWDKDSLK